MKKPRVEDFDPAPKVRELASPLEGMPPIEPVVLENHKKAKQNNNPTMKPRHHETTQPSYQEELIETIRKAVKRLGKEAATYRFTPEEKKSLADIVYSYKGRGIRTSENEITRISINFLMEDYGQNGAHSVLARVLSSLNA